MHEAFVPFDVLEKELLAKLATRDCSTITITGYRYLCHSIFSWLKNNGNNHYDKEGGYLFLQDYCHKHGKNQYYSNLRTTVSRLNDLLEGSWNDVHSDKGKHFLLSDDFLATIDRYCKHEADKGLATGTIRYKRYAVSWFLHEITQLKCVALEEMTPKAVSLASIRVTDHNLWNEIKRFLRYLAEAGELKADYSTLIPHYSKPYVIPSVYSIDEIKRIEEAIDVRTIRGKRDYAIILLASRMGMRSGDIVRLKIEDVQNKSHINIVQQKTGNKLNLPIIAEVKSAIEDYLSVRPPSKVQEVFINVHAPYNPISTGSIRYAMKKYMEAAGIDIGMRKKGPHVLRSSLASSMVNTSIPYETVRKVLGHSSNNAIKHYARIDIERLRSYCLDPPELSGTFKAFLHGEVQS